MDKSKGGSCLGNNFHVGEATGKPPSWSGESENGVREREKLRTPPKASGSWEEDEFPPKNRISGRRKTDEAGVVKQICSGCYPEAATQTEVRAQGCI